MRPQLMKAQGGNNIADGSHNEQPKSKFISASIKSNSNNLGYLKSKPKFQNDEKINVSIARMNSNLESNKEDRLENYQTNLVINNINSSLPANLYAKTYPLKRNVTTSENSVGKYEQIVMDELDILQKNLDFTKNNHAPLSLRRNKNMRVSTDKGSVSIPQKSNDFSMERSPTKTEEYWSNYRQISPTWTNHNENYSLTSSQLSKHRENVAKAINSRASNRLSAANEILFGQPSIFQFNFGKDDKSDNYYSPNKVVFTDRNSQNNGFESYISQQERMTKEVNVPTRSNSININRLKAFRSNAISREAFNEDFS